MSLTAGFSEEIKRELTRRWPMTNLFDILKEADLRIQFSGQFNTAGLRETIDRLTLQKRLILCLYRLGTNMGLKRISSGDQNKVKKNSVILCICRKSQSSLF
ncbi:transposase [Paenibacillus sp. SYP-B3998]|uniref:Transposase n=1 Tax=Paenibacillus sp. SYP-B3998 TaxID=2678564 RepID=A0A6G3ZX52_9BACL|nr:transposase [Paenibacillus sp. SYP-B3998]